MPDQVTLGEPMVSILYCFQQCEDCFICINAFTLQFKCVTGVSINSSRYAKDLQQENFALS